MNILVLDIYPSTNHRISKDQNGGYGTANNYVIVFLENF